jgi:hypothetical protein
VLDKKVLLIVPTRSRPDSSIEFYESYKENSKITDLLFALDDDDVDYPHIDGVMYEINPRMGMNGTLNFVANKHAEQYDYIAFMGDDHRIRTNGWDEQLVDSISGFKNGIAYGNDLLQGENLPTAVLLDANIVCKLGYMAPPKQRHLYLDDFWKHLGTTLDTLRYSANVIIEHLHFTAGKSEVDALYQEVNNPGLYSFDQNEYSKYLADQFNFDLEKLRR